MSITTATLPAHVLRASDLDGGQIERLLDLADRMKREPFGHLDALPGRSVVTLFDKPSTRTRVSFAAAAYRLGMLPQVLRGDELQLGRGETIEDTARVLSGYAAAIVVRTFEQRTLERLAGAATVPVVNALTDDHHPCQALADLMTIRGHFGRLGGLRVAYVGDGNNVAHSLLEAGAAVGMDVVVACPGGYEPDPAVVAAAAAVAQASGGSIAVTGDPVAAVTGAHAVYTDVWVSMGEDDERAARQADLRGFQVGATLMAHARPEAIFLHCLPAHRGEEVSADVIDGPQSLVFEQAANRLPTEQALLLSLISRRG